MIRAELEKKVHQLGLMTHPLPESHLSSNATLVTHNTKEFSRIEGLVFEDWF
jgi:tRNA(fMet)-specific endonuclease VapC